ncbi:uncharacterized protein ACA1_160030 [Acanthamoeba castellanii str. Neff]|uniref:Uncharacterized protein n=1 Tax=Acanthamoeba castellanii (strain ATCC 30010 / Neff) TaxID=1257118 RepID=L8HAE2_ACACF|nr:uncharacterized protein ACA1_160030 [Acanthamoeba castellanii str. Neff]ELR22145.1 hypothetical protein ACA1_160030 [Acanthamoeba castellanii str. Neff]
MMTTGGTMRRSPRQGKLKTELQAQESQTADQLSSLLAKGLGLDAKAFEEFDHVMKSCPP